MGLDLTRAEPAGLRSQKKCLSQGAVMRLPPVILASQSPRRQQLLRTVLRRFEVDVSHADEIAPSWLTPGETAQANAWLKARAVAARHPKALVIGSDTVVALGSALARRGTLRPVTSPSARRGRSRRLLLGMWQLGRR